MEEIEVKSSSRVAPLIGVFFVLLAVALYAFYARPLSQSVAKVSEEVDAKQVQVQDLSAKITQLTEAEKTLGLSTQVQKFEVLKSIPAEINQDEIIRDLINISKSHDIQLHSISFGKGASSQEKVSVLRINASFEGNYNDLIGFLEGLEQNARTLQVSSINVQINTLEVTSVKRATFSLAMDAYFQEK